MSVDTIVADLVADDVCGADTVAVEDGVDAMVVLGVCDCDQVGVEVHPLTYPCTLGVVAQV